MLRLNHILSMAVLLAATLLSGVSIASGIKSGFDAELTAVPPSLSSGSSGYPSIAFKTDKSGAYPDLSKIPTGRSDSSVFKSSADPEKNSQISGYSEFNRIFRLSGRSDRDLFLRVQSVLNSRFPGLTDRITVSVNEGFVTLSGTVRTAWQKEAATEAVMRLEDVVAVENHTAISSSVS